MGFIAVQILPRIAVPFFFCVSGLFFFRKLEAGEECVLSTFLRIFKLYVFWSIIYLVKDVVVNVYTRQMSLSGFVKDFFIRFFIYGTSYHFWFFIALMISVIIVGVFYRLKLKKLLMFLSVLLYIAGLLGESYFFLGNSIPFYSEFINSSSFIFIRRVFFMGLPFFVSGYFADYLLKHLSNGKVNFLLVLSVLLFLFEIVVLKYFGLAKSVVITAFLYILVLFVMIWLIKHPMASKTKSANKFRGLANYTFFVHPIFILIIESICLYFGFCISNLVLYFFVVVFCILTWSILRLIKKPLIKKYVTG